MKIFSSFDSFVFDGLGPIVLTIGNFDGVHRGHLALFQELSVIKGQKGAAVAITYTSHPSQTLCPTTPTCLLCSSTHKLKLLEKAGLDVVFALTFDRQLANQQAHDFLACVRTRLPFSHLVLGYDAHFGKDRGGNKETARKIAEDLGFSLTYLAPVVEGKTPISSSQIREALLVGDLDQVALLLGRPYSVQGVVLPGSGQGKVLGVPTANLPLEGLCTPPHGVYLTTCVWKGQYIKAIANLGTAPTMQTGRDRMLEVHLPGQNLDLYGQELEVIFDQFIRPEQTFSSQEALRAQIQHDLKYLA